MPTIRLLNVGGARQFFFNRSVSPSKRLRVVGIGDAANELVAIDGLAGGAVARFVFADLEGAGLSCG